MVGVSVHVALYRPTPVICEQAGCNGKMVRLRECKQQEEMVL